jgi:hypothetical protein
LQVLQNSRPESSLLPKDGDIQTRPPPHPSSLTRSYAHLGQPAIPNHGQDIPKPYSHTYVADISDPNDPNDAKEPEEGEDDVDDPEADLDEADDKDDDPDAAGLEVEQAMSKMGMAEILDELNSRFLVNLPTQEYDLIRLYWQTEQA